MYLELVHDRSAMGSTPLRADFFSAFLVKQSLIPIIMCECPSGIVEDLERLFVALEYQQVVDIAVNVLKLHGSCALDRTKQPTGCQIDGVGVIAIQALYELSPSPVCLPYVSQLIHEHVASVKELSFTVFFVWVRMLAALRQRSQLSQDVNTYCENELSNEHTQMLKDILRESQTSRVIRRRKSDNTHIQKDRLSKSRRFIQLIIHWLPRLSPGFVFLITLILLRRRK